MEGENIRRDGRPEPRVQALQWHMRGEIAGLLLPDPALLLEEWTRRPPQIQRTTRGRSIADGPRSQFDPGTQPIMNMSRQVHHCISGMQDMQDRLEQIMQFCLPVGIRFCCLATGSTSPLKEARGGVDTHRRSTSTRPARLSTAHMVSLTLSRHVGDWQP